MDRKYTSEGSWAGIERFYLKCSIGRLGRLDSDVKKELSEKVMERLIADKIARIDVVDDAIQITMPMFIDGIDDAMRGIERNEYVGKFREKVKENGPERT